MPGPLLRVSVEQLSEAALGGELELEVAEGASADASGKGGSTKSGGSAEPAAEPAGAEAPLESRPSGSGAANTLRAVADRLGPATVSAPVWRLARRLPGGGCGWCVACCCARCRRSLPIMRSLLNPPALHHQGPDQHGRFFRGRLLRIAADRMAHAADERQRQREAGVAKVAAGIGATHGARSSKRLPEPELMHLFPKDACSFNPAIVRPSAAAAPAAAALAVAPDARPGRSL